MPDTDYAAGNTQRLTLDISGCTEETRIYELTGRQTLSAPYELTARFLCAIPDLVLSELAQQAAIITLRYKNEQRYFHGIIKDAALLGENGQSYTYEITLVPKLWFLNYRRNCRIFQHQTVTDIVTRLLQEAGLDQDAFQMVLKDDYPKLDYCVQFNETDFAFLSRLLERNGIHYHFVHEHHRHRLVFADRNETLPYLDGPEVELRPRNGLEPDYTTLASFAFGARVGFDHASHIGFDLTRPSRELRQEQRLKDSHFLEHYSFHDHQSYPDAEAGQHYIDQSLQAFAAQQHFASADSDIIRMEPGHRFQLTNHLRPDCNRKYLVHSVHFTVRQYTALEQYTPEEAGFHYDNHGQFIPADITFKPPQLTPKPQLDYQDGVFVTGPEGEEIYTDAYGRIKVQFPWDREGRQDEDSSCWVPVSQSWAGNQWGKIQIPRIGHEVLVSFINGDPDQPVVMGSLYNGVNAPPYPLPRHKTRSTTKSNSTLGGQGFNEIRFEDKKSREQVAIFAERDLDNRVKHDRREHIEHDRHLVVEQQRFEHIKNNKHVTIGQDNNIEVGRDYHLSVGQDHHTRVGSNLYIEAGDEIHIRAGHKLIFDAGDLLSMKAGGSVMKTDAGGIGFNGASIRINAGGSPGSGSGASPMEPELPEEADRDHPGYVARKRPVSPPHRSLRLMEVEAIPSPEPLPPRPAAPQEAYIPTKTDCWLNIKLVDDGGTPVANEYFRVLSGDIRCKEGKLDRHGFAQVKPLPEGEYRIVFPEQGIEFTASTQSR